MDWGGGESTLREPILVGLEFLLEFADVARVFVEENLRFRQEHFPCLISRPSQLDKVGKVRVSGARSRSSHPPKKTKKL